MGWYTSVLCICALLFMGLCSWSVMLWLSCVFLFVPVFSVYPCFLVCSSHRVSSRVAWVPWGTSVACMCAYVGRWRLWATVDRLPGPVTAGVLFVSCGPLLAQTTLLWETSCCDSLIHTLTHARTHAQTQTTQAPVSCGPVPWCCPTSPQQGPPALHRRGK